MPATAGKVPQLHSHWNAPGLVMAVGNVGEYLSFAKDYTCTFLSRDGGESWQDIDPRAMAFEFGDHVRSWPVPADRALQDHGMLQGSDIGAGGGIRCCAGASK